MYIEIMFEQYSVGRNAIDFSPFFIANNNTTIMISFAARNQLHFAEVSIGTTLFGVKGPVSFRLRVGQHDDVV